MPEIQWIFYASVVVWLGIGGYAAFLACAQNKLAQRMRLLTELRNE